MTESTIVTIVGYAYEVKDAQGKINTVCKDRTCSCGKENCWHVRQVKQYLGKGGAKAPDTPPMNTEHLEAIFTGDRMFTGLSSAPTPYRNPYSLKCFAELAVRIKAKQAQMNDDGDKGCLDAKAQYWHDVTHGVDVQEKFRLNEPSFPSHYVE